MKKIFALMAIAASILAVSCKKGGTDPGTDPGKDPEPAKYVQPITIDGDFSDWAKLPASKMAIADCPEGASKTALKLVKVFADELFVFVYLEWDKDQISCEPDVEHVPFHMYINGDGLTTTGGYADQFTDACSDLLLEGFLFDGSGWAGYDPGAYKWIGDVNGSGWGWESEEDHVLEAGSGLCSGKGIEGKYEICLIRELYPLGKIAEEFSIGFDIQQNWDSVGILPIGVDSDENPGGHVASLKVKTNHAN